MSFCEKSKPFWAGLWFGVVFGFCLGFLAANLLCQAEAQGTSIPFVRAVIASESSFNSKALSKAGARGLMQLMPSTADMVHRELFGTGIPKERLYDPYVSISLGTTYLLEMIYEFRDLNLALAAYNAGPGAVRRGFKAKQYVNKIRGLACSQSREGEK